MYNKKIDPNGDATDTENNDESMFALTILEKIKETRLKFSDEELPHEAFVTIRQSITKCNAISNNTSINIKLSKDQVLKFSQGGVTVL